MSTDTLNDRIAHVLKSDVPSAVIVETIAEAEADLRQIADERDATEERSLDPLLAPAEVEDARAKLDSLAFRARRLKVAIDRLNEMHEAAKAREAEAGRGVAYDAAKAARDAAADDLRKNYPVLARKLAELLDRVVKADALVARANQAMPAGAEPLKPVEMIVRRVMPNGMVMAPDGTASVISSSPLTTSVRLPEMDAVGSGQIWPAKTNRFTLG